MKVIHLEGQEHKKEAEKNRQITYAVIGLLVDGLLPDEIVHY